MAKTQACKIGGCKRAVRAKGYCRIHYNKWRKGEYGKTRYKICKAEGCRKRRFLKAYCEAHYKSEYLKKAEEEAKA
ncbi:MAG TPA: vegetative protein [bacterium]|nr:vegetative protein [bacterium]